MVHLGPKKPPARKGSMADILTRFFQCRLQNKLGLQDILDFFCNLCGHSMVRTCNMVEAAQKQNRITFGSIYVKLHPLVKLCTGIVWAPRV